VVGLRKKKKRGDGTNRIFGRKKKSEFFGLKRRKSGEKKLEAKGENLKREKKVIIELQGRPKGGMGEWRENFRMRGLHEKGQKRNLERRKKCDGSKKKKKKSVKGG